MLGIAPKGYGGIETDKLLNLSSLLSKPMPNWDTDVSSFTLKGA